MAIQATSADRTQLGRTGGASSWQTRSLARVAGVLVAFLTQERRTRLKQIGNGGPVWVVADRAVLGHRLVVVHERSALFHVAGVAGFVDAAFDQLLRIVAVWVMAVRTGNLAFLDRMARRPVDLRALLLVAREADFQLGKLVAHFVACHVHLVTRGTRDVAVGVGA